MKFLILITTFICSIAFAQTELPQNIQEIALKLKESKIGCSERIWKNYNWKNVYLFLVDSTTRDVYQWDG